jgi:hypothetical protein
LGTVLGIVSLKKVKKRSKSLQMLSARRPLFLSRDSNNCEEFRSGQEKQSDGFESAAYANFATPAALENKLLIESYQFCGFRRWEISSKSASRRSFEHKLMATSYTGKDPTSCDGETG